MPGPERSAPPRNARGMVKEMLSRARCFPPSVEIQQWTVAEVRTVERWAAAVINGDLPPPPAWLEPFVARAGEGEAEVRKRTRSRGGHGGPR